MKLKRCMAEYDEHQLVRLWAHLRDRRLPVSGRLLGDFAFG
jgi:hypothetical protein